MPNTNKTPLQTATDYRISWIRDEERKLSRARSNYLFSLEEVREAAQAQLDTARAQLALLRTLPEGLTIEQIRAALDAA